MLDSDCMVADVLSNKISVSPMQGLSAGKIEGINLDGNWGVANSYLNRNYVASQGPVTKNYANM